MPENPIVWGVVIFFLIIFLIIFALIFQFIGLYVRALVSGAKVGILDLVGMRLRRINPNLVVNARIQATRAGLQISQPEMETHILAGGDIQRVIAAMIAANKANIDLPWKTARSEERR